jgi:nitrogen fixation NifU-like protein
MADSRELYQQTILEHNKHPRNFFELDPCSHHAEGFNPLCGDHFWVYLNVDAASGEVLSASFKGEGCAISKASASMMTEKIKGLNGQQLRKVFAEFQAMVKGELNLEQDEHQLGKLKIFSGIAQYPARVKCAGLAWHTMVAALDKQTAVTTE